jgi:RND family efflux transporter MFP subunit
MGISSGRGLRRDRQARPAKRLPLFYFLLPIFLCGLAGCDNAPAAKASKKPKVVVTRPITDTVMDYQDFTGRLDAVKSIEIRARVSGYLVEAIQAADFKGNVTKEGDIVKEGDQLFLIDRRPYEADLNQAEANLRLAIADRDLMEKNADRARRLFASKAMAREDMETAVAAFEKSAAAVGSAQAARDKSKLYLDYTKVVWEQDKTDPTRPPMTGRISRRFVDPGNMVIADNTVLTSIVTEDPMYAYFDVDERTYLDLLAAGPVSTQSPANAREASSAGVKLPVLLRLANETDFDKERVGYVDFVDNRVIPMTGTVRMRGVIRNPTGQLKAGLFARVRLPIGTAYDAILIPDAAIQNDQERKYVFVVNAKNEVEYRSVKLGQAVGDLRVIRPAEKGNEGKEGLTKDDRVIIEGMQRVRKDSIVEPVEKTPPAPPEMALVRLLKKPGN